MIYLPTQNWAATPVVARDTLQASAVSAQDTQVSLPAENARLRIVYGQARVGPLIPNVLAYNGGLVILAVWCHGEVDSVVDLQIDDKALPSGVTATHYLGTAGQTAPAMLVAAFAAQSPAVVFTDAMPGVCYSVVFVPSGASSGFPRLNAVVKGRKVYDPRLDSSAGGSGAHRLATPSTWAWSDNPSLCLADFCANALFGAKRLVDWTSAAGVATDCDVLAGGTEPLRTLNLAIETVQKTAQWIDTLRAYAACWVVPSSNGLKFVSDKARSPVGTFDHDAGTIRDIKSLKLRGVQTTPTVMTIVYTDTSSTPYRDMEAIVKAPGVDAGTTPRRESSVSMPGINRHSQAVREATERLNKLLLNDLSLSLDVFDDGLAYEIGDVVTVTHPVGLTAKQVYIAGTGGEYGRFSFQCIEYDPAAYCSLVTATPTWPNTTLPSPASPPAVTGVVMAEEVFQLENGTWSSRWRVTWAAAAYTFLDHYRAELWAGSVLIHSARVASAEWPTPAVQEGVTYTAKVAAVTSIGAIGAWGTQSATALGKQLLPSDVPSVTAFEAGGTVYASCTPAVDIDIIKYEWRYWAGGGSWATGNLIDRADSLRMQSDQIPVGTWTLGVKAIDSVLQSSLNAATCSVIVTSDASAFLVATKTHTVPTLTNMLEYSLARNDTNRYFVTDDAVAWDTKFSAALNTYTNPLATYHNSVTSTWLGDALDWGLDLGGQWTGTAGVTDISGSHISYIGKAMAAAPGTWTYTAGLSQKLNARFARMKHEALTTSTLGVTIPTQSIRLDAIPREEVVVGTSLSTGPLTVTLTGSYVAVKKLTITPFGTTARSAVADNITFVGAVAKFDVYIFDNNNTKIASQFRAEWQGV